jgi:hypothetical protein
LPIVHMRDTEPDTIEPNIYELILTIARKLCTIIMYMWNTLQVTRFKWVYFRQIKAHVGFLTKLLVLYDSKVFFSCTRSPPVILSCFTSSHIVKTDQYLNQIEPVGVQFAISTCACALAVTMTYRALPLLGWT